MILSGPIGFLLVGWIAARRWTGLHSREVSLASAIALIGTWLSFAAFPPFDGWTRGFRVLLIGFWLLTGVALAWFLRKRRRIMQEANTE